MRRGASCCSTSTRRAAACSRATARRRSSICSRNPPPTSCACGRRIRSRFSAVVCRHLLYKPLMSHRLEIELDEQVAARLEAAATKERKTAEAFAVDAVVRALEDIEAWTEDETAYAEYERT